MRFASIRDTTAEPTGFIFLGSGEEAFVNIQHRAYNDHIDKVSHAVCATHQEARELASSVMAHLFFCDREGQSRIASYDGRIAVQRGSRPNA